MSKKLFFVDFNLSGVDDYEDFHDFSSKLFGFPDSYGRNMNAWIDCIRSVNSPSEGLSKLTIEEDEVLVLVIYGLSGLIERNKELANSFLYCLGFANDMHHQKWKTIALSYVVKS